ncbi:MAG TPA: glycosyltransferase, partial [Longimicrobium sp.]|nr:glycosyltransferase [Longimicrobium sp.]
MAHGNVVVSTDYRAIPDLVEDGVSGRLVPYGRPEAIAEAVSEAVETPGRFEEMSRAAVARFRGHFTREAHLERLLAHILPGAPAPAPRPGAARAAAGPA